jgi:Uma2 family endonuclease
MTTAELFEATITPGSEPAIDRCQNGFVFDNVAWADYEAMLRIVGDRPIRLTYDRGVLTIMSPLRKHNGEKKLLGSMIETLVLELKIPYEMLGSTTWKREDLLKGIEADECYYFENALKLVPNQEIDLKVAPPPDLAVEVDVTSESIDRLRIYASLGVREVWRYRQGVLEIWVLGSEGSLEKSTVSRNFPFLDMNKFVEFLHLSKSMIHSHIMEQFQEWVRTEVRPFYKEWSTKSE